jgi:hypothetical protein
MTSDLGRGSIAGRGRTDFRLRFAFGSAFSSMSEKKSTRASGSFCSILPPIIC